MGYLYLVQFDGFQVEAWARESEFLSSILCVEQQ